MGHVLAHLEAGRVPLLVGPVERNDTWSASVPMYLGDPDRNLIEVSRYGS